MDLGRAGISCPHSPSTIHSSAQYLVPPSMYTIHNIIHGTQYTVHLPTQELSTHVSLQPPPPPPPPPSRTVGIWPAEPGIVFAPQAPLLLLSRSRSGSGSGSGSGLDRVLLNAHSSTTFGSILKLCPVAIFTGSAS